MDPNATLMAIDRLIARIETPADWIRMMELVEALDNWIARGGSTPTWSRSIAASAVYTALRSGLKVGALMDVKALDDHFDGEER